MSGLGQYRPVERIQPGWLIYVGAPDEQLSDDNQSWCEVRAILEFRSGKREIHFMDGTRTYGHVGSEVRCITNAEKRERRQALGVAS